MRESPGDRYPYYLDPALEKKASAFARKVSARIDNRLNRDGIPNANELALLRSNLGWMWRLAQWFEEIRVRSAPFDQLSSLLQNILLVFGAEEGKCALWNLLDDLLSEMRGSPSGRRKNQTRQANPFVAFRVKVRRLEKGSKDEFYRLFEVYMVLADCFAVCLRAALHSSLRLFVEGRPEEKETRSRRRTPRDEGKKR